MQHSAQRMTNPQIILAFDYGTRRIGVASGNTLSRVAQPLCTLECVNGRVPWEAINKLVRDYTPATLVVGLPTNDDGSATQMTEPAKLFATQLHEHTRCPVDLMDERHSSREAEKQLAYMRRSGIKTKRVTHADVDKVAASVVLTRWFDSHQERGQ